MLLGAIALGVWLGGCRSSEREPRDRPQDCSADEFYDQGEELCVSCPALLFPPCRSGCMVLVSDDDRGCPEASCDVSCQSCPEGTSFRNETLSCEPLCAGDARPHPLTGACSSCPFDPGTTPLDCDDQGCSCVLTIDTDESGCPSSRCGECDSPQEGFVVDDQGLCVPRL